MKAFITTIAMLCMTEPVLTITDSHPLMGPAYYTKQKEAILKVKQTRFSGDVSETLINTQLPITLKAGIDSLTSTNIATTSQMTTNYWLGVSHRQTTTRILLDSDNQLFATNAALKQDSRDTGIFLGRSWANMTIALMATSIADRQESHSDAGIVGDTIAYVLPQVELIYAISEQMDLWFQYIGPVQKEEEYNLVGRPKTYSMAAAFAMNDHLNTSLQISQYTNSWVDDTLKDSKSYTAVIENRMGQQLDLSFFATYVGSSYKKQEEASISNVSSISFGITAQYPIIDRLQASLGLERQFGETVETTNGSVISKTELNASFYTLSLVYDLRQASINGDALP